MARGIIGMSDELALAVIRTAFPSATIITEPPEETLLNSTTHACPAGNCTLQVENNMLMCPAHWRQVPGAASRTIRPACSSRESGTGSPYGAHGAVVSALPSPTRGLRASVRTARRWCGTSVCSNLIAAEGRATMTW